MKVFPLYSQRLERAQQTEPDVFRYDELSRSLRGQIEHIMDDAIGPYYMPSRYAMGSAPPHNNMGWTHIHDILCRERGVRSLTPEDGHSNARDYCILYLRSEPEVDKVLDLIEMAFRYVDRVVGDMNEYERQRRGIDYPATTAIEELNYRFREAAV